MEILQRRNGGWNRPERIEPGMTSRSNNGVAGWLLEKLGWRRTQVQACLTLVERVTLGPRQSLALIEADGHRLLVATSQEGSASFYPLDGPTRLKAGQGRLSSSRATRRVAW